MNRAGDAFEQAVALEHAKQFFRDWRGVFCFLAVFAWLVAPIIGWWCRGFKVEGESTRDRIARHIMLNGGR